MRRGNCTLPLASVKRSSSCDESSRLYCCQTSRTVTPVSGPRAASDVVIVQAGATVCGKGMKAATSITAATATIMLRALIIQLIVVTYRLIGDKSPYHSLRFQSCSTSSIFLHLTIALMSDRLGGIRLKVARAGRAHPQLGIPCYSFFRRFPCDQHTSAHDLSAHI